MTPLVGIYWIIHGKVVAFAEPAAGVQVVGGFRDSDLGHDAAWSQVVAKYPEYRGKEYWQVQRGRVSQHISSGVFHVLGPKLLLTHPSRILHIARRFKLAAGTYTVVPDEHYDPPQDDWDD